MNPDQAAVIIREQHALRLPGSWTDHHTSILCPGQWLDAHTASRMVADLCDPSKWNRTECVKATQRVIPELFSAHWSDQPV